LLAIGFPLVPHMGGCFEKRENNLFPAGKIMNKKTTL